MKGQLSIFGWIIFYTFDSLGVWVWDPRLVYWLQNSSGYGTANDEHGFNTDLFCSTKILLKAYQRVGLCKTQKTGLIFMNMSITLSKYILSFVPLNMKMN